ncbi:YqfO family protein [Sansalvadorimonas sp. 2012CJ34-2]|uniref:YqfO family protein n=1 Tax=Parendozoicomonas callyspongiae TaxID=2942213 RepID=A0ABT0PL70_9GAMM|nr:YqfO family protein [Sansalvadorimonas sp. 2012CJ34-2]MCL6272016.1 YqfO family protein [Sansalvadorimonas sp. 2012CJ34-2]
MYKLCFFVPEANLESVKQSLFAAGAGRIGDYDCCCWQTLGTGQFRPLADSNPHLGQHGVVETVSEYKVEMVCEDHLVDAAITALRNSHPYEEPAFEVWMLDPRCS